jgi:hypothetical protein
MRCLPVAGRLFSANHDEVFDMHNSGNNISAEGIARPFARLVAKEFSQESIQAVAEKGCFMSSGTNPLVWRDSDDDGT